MMRRATLWVAAYAVAAFLDLALTYYMLTIPGFCEVNPHTRIFLSSPLLLAVKEAAGVAALALLVVVMRAAFRAYGCEEAAEKVWLVALSAALIRWMTVAHNLLLLLTGWESPLTLIFSSSRI